MIRERPKHRRGRFKPPGLLASRLATLESAGRGETLDEIDVAKSSDEMAETALGVLSGEASAAR